MCLIWNAFNYWKIASIEYSEVNVSWIANLIFKVVSKSAQKYCLISIFLPFIFKLKIMSVAPSNVGTAAAAAGVARFLQSFSHGRSNPRFHFPSLTHALAHQLTGYCTLCTGVLFTQYSYHVLLRHYRDSNLGIIKDGLNSNIIFISLPTLQKKVSKQEKKFLILLRLE